MRDCKAIIEFGTSKISCTVAESKQRMGLEVLGCAQIAYSGIRKSNWVDNKEVYYALEQVLESAERQAGFRLRNVEVGIPGSFLKVVNKKAQVATKGRVTDQDIARLAESARHFDVNEDLELVHEWPAWFLLDDGNVYLDPFDMPSKKLRGCISFIFANRFFLNDAVDMLKHMGVRVNQFIPEPLAEALYLVPQDKRDELSVLVDIGYYTTNVSVIYGDTILYFNTVPMGGGNITADIAYVMKVELETAEQLKRRYSFGLEENNSISYMYAKNTDGKLKKYPYDLLKEIIDARVEHLILYITKMLARTEADIAKKLDVYLTGGGISYMRGASSFYRAIAGKTPVPIKINSIKLQTPDLHAAYAMMQYAFGGFYGPKPKEKKRGILGKSQDDMF